MDFYTYVVDSDLKLNDWLNNTPGNDYTHVYIAPGRWKLDYDRVPRQSEWYLVEYPLLDTIGTKTIEGVSGSVICDDDYEGYLKSGVNLFNYNTLNYTNYIKGITVELNHVESYSGGYIFRKCANVYDCNIINLCHSNDDSNTIRSCEIFFSECINIHDNFIKFGTTSTYSGQYGSFSIFENCVNITNCIVEYIQDSDNVYVTSDDGYNYYFDNCKNIYNVIFYTDSPTEKLKLNGMLEFSVNHSCNLMHVINKTDYVTDSDYGQYAGINNNGIDNVYECSARKSFDEYSTGISHCMGLDKYSDSETIPSPIIGGFWRKTIYSGDAPHSSSWPRYSNANHVHTSSQTVSQYAALNTADGGYNNFKIEYTQ